MADYMAGAVLKPIILHKLKWQRYSRTFLLMLGCAMFLLGLVVSRRYSDISGWIVLQMLCGAAYALRRRTFVAIIEVLAGELLLGLWRGVSYIHELKLYQTLACSQEVLLAGLRGGRKYY